jgi:aerobic carbon-monoxide dehydrogenase medium subunit
MKPVAFEYVRPASLDEAIGLLAETPDAKILAGGQTLGPMLNLRLAQPAILVDITRIAELAAVGEEADAVILGATITHAAIEDGRVPDPTRGFLARIAQGIAYRAVRCRGTIGGSLAHADPAADWLSSLAALRAEIDVAGPAGSRRIEIGKFVRGAMESDLAPGEILAGIRIPKFSTKARFGYHKICRKAGEFAEAIGAVAIDPERGTGRLVTSTDGGAPLIFDVSAASETAALTDPARLRARLAAAVPALARDDAYALNIHVAALQRALREAGAP